MDLKDLEHFVAVAEAGGFRRASIALSVVQSALSRRVRALEDELGVSLLERSAGGTRLTTAGESFLAQVRIILRDLHGAIQSAGKAGIGQDGCLRIGLLTSLSRGPHRQIFEAFRTSHPHVTLHFDEYTRSELFEGLRQHSLDLGILSGDVPKTCGDSFIIYESSAWIAMHTKHPLAGATALTWNDVRHEHFLVFKGLSGAEDYDYIVCRTAQLDHQPRISRYGIGREALLNLVGMGVGVAVTSDTWRGAIYPNVVYVPLEPSERVMFNLAWLHDNDNPALRRFISLAKSHCSGPRARHRCAAEMEQNYAT